MRELVKISEHNGKQAVSARELYEKLGYDISNWKRWYKKNVSNNQFAIENEDYAGFVIMTSGNETQDFALSIDFAKKLSMMARTDAGEKIRDYFIEVEKLAKQNVKNLTPAEQLLYSAQLLVAQEAKLQEHDERLLKLEAKTLTTPEYFTVAGFARISKKFIARKTAIVIGKRAAKICKDNGWEIGKINDERWGLINSYPKEALKTVFAVS